LFAHTRTRSLLDTPSPQPKPRVGPITDKAPTYIHPPKRPPTTAPTAHSVTKTEQTTLPRAATLRTFAWIRNPRPTAAAAAAGAT